MYIKKLDIKKFKNLNNFQLNFPESNVIDFDGDKEMKLTVLIGENGTSKTTILQSIIEAFSDNNVENSQESIFFNEINLEYERFGKVFKVNNKELMFSHKHYPKNIIISSYTMIDKILKMSMENCLVPVKGLGVPNNRRIISRNQIRNSAQEVLKLFADNKLENIKSILNYIGFKDKQIYFEFSRHALSSTRYSQVIREINSLQRRSRKKNSDFEEIYKSNLTEEQLMNKYIKTLNNFSEKMNIKMDYKDVFSQRFKDISQRNDIYDLRNFNIIIPLIEYTFIIEKFRLLFMKSNILDTSNFKDNMRNRLFSIELLDNYPGKKRKLLKDLKFLDSLSINIITDIWFMEKEDSDLVPLSMLSSGELSMFLRFFDMHNHVADGSILLIDEPETHLHPKWISGYVKTLLELFGDIKCHVIIATHSPLIISDVTRNSVVGLKKASNSIEQTDIHDKTLGLNYEDILLDIFNVEQNDGAMIYKYKSMIEEALLKDNLDLALKIYSQVADTTLKFNLYKKIVKFKDEKKLRGE